MIEEFKTFLNWWSEKLTDPIVILGLLLIWSLGLWYVWDLNEQGLNQYDKLCGMYCNRTGLYGHFVTYKYGCSCVDTGVPLPDWNLSENPAQKYVVVSAS